VRAILQGVADRGALARLDAVLSGYLGDVALGEVVLETVAASRPAFYACDPVMGDVGRGFFVRPGLPDFIRDRAVPRADLITPNRFELEFLAGRDVRTLDDALAASASLRANGPKLVLVTSLDRADAAPDTIEMLVDSADGAWLVQTPLLKLEPMPNGAGDAVAALFLSHWLSTRDAATALARAASGIYAIFEATKEKGQRELALIAAQDEFAAATPRFAAQKAR
jgi:pyridoxine kinase